MSIAGISQSQPLAPPPKAREGMEGADQIKALEQKIQKLNTEKQKAAQKNDKESEKRIEKQIQELKKRLEQLRNQDQGKQAELPQEKPKDMSRGKYIDELV